LLHVRLGFGRLLDQERPRTLHTDRRGWHGSELDGTLEPDEHRYPRSEPRHGKSPGARVITGHSNLLDACHRTARAGLMSTNPKPSAHRVKLDWSDDVQL
jgi:hypothetical protein